MNEIDGISCKFSSQKNKKLEIVSLGEFISLSNISSEKRAHIVETVRLITMVHKNKLSNTRYVQFWNVATCEVKSFIIRWVREKIHTKSDIIITHRHNKPDAF